MTNSIMKTLIWTVTLASFLAIATSRVHAASFTVDAFVNSSSGTGVGLNTGLSLAAGQPFTVTVDPHDLWSAGSLPLWSNADGLVGDLFATGTDDSGQPVGTLIGIYHDPYTQSGLTAPFGALVGELSGTFFVLGSSFSGPAPAAGTLHLFYWDSNNYDNTEHVVADIHVRGADPVPEPTTLALLGLGLAAFLFSRRCQSWVG